MHGLSEKEVERLVILSEECGEVIQAIGKILRHGMDSYNPNLVNPISNREHLEKELGDVIALIQICEEEDLVNEQNIIVEAENKLNTVPQYMHY